MGWKPPRYARPQPLARAERTTTLAGPGGDLMQATAVWVAVGRDGQPAELGPGFHRCYGQAAGRRRVTARLTLPGPAPSAAGSAWPLRATDFDSAGHVNNAVHWAAAEDILAGLDWLPATAELEYRRPILPRHAPELLTSVAADQVLFWLVNDGKRLASGRLTRTSTARRGDPGPGADRAHRSITPLPVSRPWCSSQWTATGSSPRCRR